MQCNETSINTRKLNSCCDTKLDMNTHAALKNNTHTHTHTHTQRACRVAALPADGGDDAATTAAARTSIITTCRAGRRRCSWRGVQGRARVVDSIPKRGGEQARLAVKSRSPRPSCPAAAVATATRARSLDDAGDARHRAGARHRDRQPRGLPAGGGGAFRCAQRGEGGWGLVVRTRSCMRARTRLHLQHYSLLFLTPPHEHASPRRPRLQKRR